MTFTPLPSQPQSTQPLEERAALLLQLRRSGVRDLNVMRAIESVPRELFTPHRFKDLANRNLALPIGCGQTLPAPADLARRLAALAPQPHHRVFEVGVGSGYGAAVLARLVRELVCVERFESLAIEAAQRLAALSIANALVLFGDGLAPSRALGEFDRILLDVSVEEPPAPVVDLLGPGGVMVFGRLEPAARGARFRRSRLVTLTRADDGSLAEADLGLCRHSAALPGAASAL